MMLRELTKDEIRSLSGRHGVKGRAIKDFLAGVGGNSMESAYEKLGQQRKSKKWNLQTVSAIADGIVLATTMCEGKRELAAR